VRLMVGIGAPWWPSARTVVSAIALQGADV
jgi:hypothetical protein